MIVKDENTDDSEILLSSGLANSFSLHLYRMRKAFFKRNNHAMAEAGIHLPLEQISIIVILLLKKQLSQRELSDITLRDKSSVLRSISALEKKGLVLVQQDVANKRKNNISLTSEGITSANTLRALMRQAEDEVLAVFSDEERALALQTIKGYADRLEMN